jgi:N utilization substance protein A
MMMKTHSVAFYYLKINMKSQFIAAINQLCDEKGIPREQVIDAIKAALKAAYKKDYGNRNQDLDVDLRDGIESATIYLVKTVAAEIEDPDLDITLEDAKKHKKDAKVGDILRIDVTPASYGRIATQAAKQVIINKLQEAEKEVMYDMFKDRENELINAVVHRVDGSQVYLNLDGKTTSFLPYEDQIRGEKYYTGQRLKLFLDKVIKTSKGPQLLISRTHSSLVRKLMELEIPEIKSGLVEIKGIAREPGVRAKVAVVSTDPKIDPIGSCVGQKGVRVQSIMDELSGERLDIIQWSDNTEEYIRTALAPANISAIKLFEKEKRASCFVQPEQRPLAIGKNGQNVRLASNLTGWELDILDISDMKEEKKLATKEEVKEISELKDIPKSVVSKLAAANLTLVEQIKGLSVKDLTEVDGIGENSAEKVVEALKKVK